MANEVLVVLGSADREVALEVGLVYPLNAAKNKWMEQIKVILFGPSEKLAAYDAEVQGRIKELLSFDVEVLACKWCADNWKISQMLEEQGINVCYVGPVISELIKKGWATLTF